jgi:hypothetical protein
MSESTLAWQLVGIPVIVISGVLLHFAFVWAHRSRVIAVIAPVNESLWEHLKMVYWPSVVFTCVQFAFADAVPPNFAMAKALGTYAMAGVILGLYYPTALVWREAASRARLIADGTIFVVAVVLGQYVAHLLMRTTGGALRNDLIGVILLALPAAVFAVTTFRPPHTGMFMDQLTGTYGFVVERGGS